VSFRRGLLVRPEAVRAITLTERGKLNPPHKIGELSSVTAYFCLRSAPLQADDFSQVDKVHERRRALLSKNGAYFSVFGSTNSSL
jgi:hypothetical protein